MALPAQLRPTYLTYFCSFLHVIVRTLRRVAEEFKEYVVFNAQSDTFAACIPMHKSMCVL